MKPLPVKFDGRADQRGYHFKMLRRDGDLALMEKSNPEHPSGTSYYEVIIVQKFAQRQFPNGTIVEPREGMPSPEKWGTEGWSFTDYSDAENFFRNRMGVNPQ